MKFHKEFFFFFVSVCFVVFVDSCLILSFFLIFSYLLFVQSTPTDLKWTALSLNHCSGNRINASNDSITEV